MIRSAHHAQDGHLHTDLKPDEFATAQQDVEGLPWIDLVSEPLDACRPILRETFGFHPPAAHHRPQREVLNKLARGDYDVIDEGDRVFFRDMHDHH